MEKGDKGQVFPFHPKRGKSGRFMTARPATLFIVLAFVAALIYLATGGSWRALILAIGVGLIVGKLILITRAW